MNLEKKKIIINYVVSLGPFCHIAQFLKENKLRFCSYPFDWLYCKNSLEIAIDCLSNRFKNLLDKNQLINFCDKGLNQFSKIKEKQCGHKLYGDQLSPHFDLRDKSDFKYFKRCIKRLKILFKKKEQKKLFVCNFLEDSLNNTIIDNEYGNMIEKKNIIKFKNIIDNQTKNAYLLIFKCYYKYPKYINKINNIEYFKNNIIFINLYTSSVNHGLGFYLENDNAKFKELFFSIFEFELINDIKLDINLDKNLDKNFLSLKEEN